MSSLKNIFFLIWINNIRNNFLWGGLDLHLLSWIKLVSFCWTKLSFYLNEEPFSKNNWAKNKAKRLILRGLKSSENLNARVKKFIQLKSFSFWFIQDWWGCSNRTKRKSWLLQVNITHYVTTRIRTIWNHLRKTRSKWQCN